MPFLGILLIAIQFGFGYHAVKTGRETYWLYIIAFLPGIGCALYFFTQVLPEMGQSHTVRKAGNSLIKAVDPQKELRKRKDELELADTVDNRTKLARECLDAGIPEEAETLLKDCLKKGHDDDPHILLMLAEAQFSAEKFQQSKDTLERLIKTNPTFKSPDGHLLYARSLEAIGSLQDAAKEYEVLATTFPGEEARVRYGLLLNELGRTADAKTVFNESVLRAKRAPKYYQKKEKQWVKLAKQHVA